jgi:hypothetical protein
MTEPTSSDNVRHGVRQWRTRPTLRPHRPLRTLIVAVERLNREAPLCPIRCSCATCAVLLALLYLPPHFRQIDRAA